MIHIRANSVYDGFYPDSRMRYWCGGTGWDWTTDESEATCRFCKAAVARARFARSGWGKR